MILLRIQHYVDLVKDRLKSTTNLIGLEASEKSIEKLVNIVEQLKLNI